MNSLVILSLLALGLTAPTTGFAQTLDAASLEALQATLRMLGDPTQRDSAISRDSRASGIDTQIRVMAGSEKVVEEFYALAGQIFEELARNSGGDVSRMNETLARAPSDPAAFAALLSPATLTRLRELSVKMSDRSR